MFTRTSRRAMVLTLGLTAFAAVAASSAHADPPANDPFATPTNLAGPTTNTVAGTTTESTLEGPEFDHIGDGGSVWYTWTAPGSGTASFNTCDTEIDHVITVVTGAAMPGTLVAEDDDSCDELQGGASLGAAVTFPVTNGTQYKIAVSAFGADPEDEGAFTLKGPQAPPPPEPPVTPITPAIPAVPTVTSAIPASPAASKKCKKGFKKVKGKCKKVKKKK